jgi:hypothetical protein
MNFEVLNIARSALKSSKIRSLIGERTYDAAAALTKEDSNEPGIFSTLFNIGAKFVGFLCNVVFSGISWSLSTIWEILIEIYFEIKYFDWNQTDKELKQQISANNDRIAGAFGQLLGSGLVWTTGIAVATGF